MRFALICAVLISNIVEVLTTHAVYIQRMKIRLSSSLLKCSGQVEPHTFLKEFSYSVIVSEAAASTTE